MRVLALITARGGSKRLPGKNIRVLGAKPLIVWSIDVAKGNPEICDILVSTDDTAIAGVAAAAGAMVPWLRPAVLATDTANSLEVVMHALDWYEAAKGAVDGVLLLQPTSPFRTKQTLIRGMELFRKNGFTSVLGVSPSTEHPMWSMKIETGCLVPFVANHGLGLRSQDLPPAYIVNGSFYLISPLELRTTRSFFGPNSNPLLIESPQESLDIDTDWDWIVANAHIASTNFDR